MAVRSRFHPSGGGGGGVPYIQWDASLGSPGVTCLQIISIYTTTTYAAIFTSLVPRVDGVFVMK